jgi:type IV fimbrial biogenesis protein FimT
MIALAVTVPNYLSLTRKNQATSVINALVAEIQLTRSESLKRSAPVSMCPTADGATCNTGGSPWLTSNSAERLIFVDDDGDGAVDAGETVIKRVANGSPDMTLAVLNPVPAPTFLGFTRKGLLTSASARIQITDAEGDSRCLQVHLTGRSELGACP